jgi:membrane associated rhomboid family serine protease
MESTAAKRREPILNLPLVVGIVVAVLYAIHLGRMALPEPIDDYLVGLFAFAPGRYIGEPPGYAPWPGGVSAEIWSPFTYALLHNDFLHLTSNAVVLAALGNVLARRTTSARFLLFVVVMAPISALGEIAIAFWQSAPVIGISGVICAMMGGFARVMFPREIPPGEMPSGPYEYVAEEDVTEAPGSAAAPGFGPERPRAVRVRRFEPPVAGPIAETLMRPRVLQFIAAFAILNLVLVFGAPVLVGGGAAVAWSVHVAGFIGGFLLWPFFDLVR